MKHAIIFGAVLSVALAMPSLASSGADSGLIVEDVGPYKDAPGTLQRQRIENGDTEPEVPPVADEAVRAAMDTDRDGISDADDRCPDSPRLAGSFNIGEVFVLDGVAMRYMGLRGQGSKAGEQLVFHTIGLEPEEGRNQSCVITDRGNGPVSCVFEGVPPIEILLLERLGTKVNILVRHRVDETGCSPEP